LLLSLLVAVQLLSKLWPVLPFGLLLLLLLLPPLLGSNMVVYQAAAAAAAAAAVAAPGSGCLPSCTPG
jgi:hypothetical protein